MNSVLTLKKIKNQYCICKLSPSSEIPNWVYESTFYSITKSEEELSIVCEETVLPDNLLKINCDKNWSVLKIEGILDFSLVGILSKISTILANQNISIFAISTYNTDYILIKSSQIDTAIDCLQNNNYEIL